MTLNSALNLTLPSNFFTGQRNCFLRNYELKLQWSSAWLTYRRMGCGTTDGYHARMNHHESRVTGTTCWRRCIGWQLTLLQSGNGNVMLLER